MKNRILIMLLPLTFVSFFMIGCSPTQETAEILSPQQKQEVETQWKDETGEIRKDRHVLFDAADLIGTVIEKKGSELKLSTIAREEQDGENTGGILFGTDLEDEWTIELPKEVIVQKFMVNNQAQPLEDSTLNAVTAGSIVSLFGTYDDEKFVAERLVVWSLQNAQ